MKRICLCALVFASLLALPVLAAPVDRIDNGIDVWWTAGDGTTFVNFANQPIPKGFFCPRAEAFKGRVVLQGRPLATANPGELGGADTVVQRLDDATFDKSGVATTRIQLRALQLESVAPIKTSCGEFNVHVGLDGQQPITKMRIIRETDNGGRFVAPIRVNFKMTFTPAGGISARRLELAQGFQLLPAPNATWGEARPKHSSARPAVLMVDSDGDQVPDILLPKSSGNFLIGVTRAGGGLFYHRPGGLAKDLDPVACDEGTTVNYGDYGDYGCHTGPDPECHPETEQTGQHCSRPCVPCDVVGTGIAG
jgi:hypothetical protein